MKHQNIFRWMFFLLLATASLVPVLSTQTNVSAQAQLPTPTAQPDGRIIYIAQPGDSWWIIAVKNNTSEDALYQLNNTTPDDPIVEGQKVLIGIVTPTEVPTAAPFTPTPNILTPVVHGSGEICAVLFDDVNGNSSHETDEPFLANGAISIVDTTGQINKTGATTAGPDPICFADMPEGDYNLSVAIPEGFNATTSMNAPLKLLAGDKSTMNFGAQSKTAAVGETGNTSSGRNPVVAIVGGIFILGGIGVGIYFLRQRR
jgi:hypothetical protein